MSKIPVLEIFGPTIQGEGMVVGRKTMFVRTAGCDYQCSWCDSSFTWDGSAKNEIKQMTADEIWEQLYSIGGDYFDHVTISGGNPALLSSLGLLTSLLNRKNIAIALETQGSKWQPWFYEIDDLTISPKPPSSNMVTNFDTLDEIVDNLIKSRSNFSLKVVVFDEEDFHYAKKVHNRYRGVPFYLQVGNDDIHSDDHEQLANKLLKKYEWLVDETMQSCEMNSVRVLPQLHTLVWGNKRGV
ncbi:7-carboxy-7-deazaguanine synthase QueE [Aquibacillus sp. 3ASR75-11]|uniref:7-carboxy-7-deazaguanine synthase n=1 Tax=Terrihalobacillus insolitus TaxID=2950438 RepID=A0A9X4AKQ6_9BACI|nr:7-carboxy-7-deazaguanine synthase QueE [Terrihalobacillus insolitus]MDC3411958.1 7-carboxy-7-deazaguanine synthase QueE [Terrihalobacillus insolitus]MDC3423356.1 7-carboxy-7-deazaguanine synthase QueE [Terrihalobacillus insolitus]